MKKWLMTLVIVALLVAVLTLIIVVLITQAG